MAFVPMRRSLIEASSRVKESNRDPQLAGAKHDCNQSKPLSMLALGVVTLDPPELSLRGMPRPESGASHGRDPWTAPLADAVRGRVVPHETGLGRGRDLGR